MNSTNRKGNKLALPSSQHSKAHQLLDLESDVVSDDHHFGKQLRVHYFINSQSFAMKKLHGLDYESLHRELQSQPN